MAFLFTSILVLGGLYDFMQITNRRGSKLLKAWGLITGFILHAVLFYRYFYNQTGEEIITLGTVFILITIFLIQLLFKQDVRFSILGICTTVTGILYVVWLFSYLVRITYLEEPNGSWIVANLLLIAKSGDIFAYVIGKRFGKHKLTERISPGKTIEGSVAGILGSIIVAYIVTRITPVPQKMVDDAVILGFIIGLFAQFGDLGESMLKRNAQVKDSGSYIPGMGGVLDLLDSVLFNAPLMYYYIRYFVGAL